MIFGQPSQLRVALQVQRLVDLGRLKRIPRGLFPPRLAPRREADRRHAVDEDVVVDDVLLASVDLNAAEAQPTRRAPVEHVAVHHDAADRVVQPDAGPTGPQAGSCPLRCQPPTWCQ